MKVWSQKTPVKNLKRKEYPGAHFSVGHAWEKYGGAFFMGLYFNDQKYTVELTPDEAEKLRDSLNSFLNDTALWRKILKSKET